MVTYMENRHEKIFALGPYIFALNSNPEWLKIKTGGKAFILSASVDMLDVNQNMRAAIHMYQDIRRAGYPYLMFLQEVDTLRRICFAIPMDKEIEEQRKMVQWIVSKNPGSKYYEWYADCYDKVFDESNICGYRIAHNRHQENRLKTFGELF